MDRAAPSPELFNTAKPAQPADSVISDAGRIHLRWALTEGIGPILFSRLIEMFGSAEAALGQPPGQLQKVSGIGRERADRIAREQDRIDIDAEIAACAEHGIRIICRADDDYPPGLRQIPDAPMVLYLRGELRPTDAVAVAIVGSRRCTIYGSEQARRFGELLAGAGFTVISGLARGIDAFAHHGAVDAGGRSIAVMGNGLHEVYPPENRELGLKLLDSGAWISELPVRAAVRAENFPSRNRIIAGMSLGTIVIEAAARSGALITARLAGEYNREVFALPGRAQDPMSIGTNALIRDGGAKLITCLEDVLQELGDVGKRMTPAATKPAESSRGSQPPAIFSAAEQAVLARISDDPTLQDLVISAAGLPAGETLAALTSLELKGAIRRLPGALVARRNS